MTKLFNDAMNISIFPDQRKLVEVTAIFKKDDPTESKNSRPVIVSTVFERIMDGHLFC